MPPPRTASGDAIYVMYAYGKVTITVCPCWLASTTNKSGLVTLTFDLLILKVVSKSRVTWWATSVPILVFLGLSVVDLGPMYATDRQTDRRQTSNSIIAECPLGGGIIIHRLQSSTVNAYIALSKTFSLLRHAMRPTTADRSRLNAPNQLTSS